MLKGKKILLGISGSIAAYKTPILVRLLIKAGAEVKVVMTPSAVSFVAPLTLSTLSRNEVLYELSENDSWSNHVMLGRWADIMLMAPLSCNTLAKMANGLCDNLLMAVYLSATTPVVVAPAMDEDMWNHPSTKRNISIIESYGNEIIPVEVGELASGLFGPGRMAEPNHILKWLEDYFQSKNEYKHKKVMVTAGPTYESIDPVRFIGNHSSGKMGVALAAEFKNRGAEVTFISGPIHEKVPVGIEWIKVTNAEEMYQACLDNYLNKDIIVMSAAVADYTVANPSALKIKKKSEELILSLQKTKDILRALGSVKKKNQLLVGFALETDNEEEYALNKLKDKQADLIVLNSMNVDGAGFSHDTNKVTIFDKFGKKYAFEKKSKQKVAVDIINTISNFIHE